MTHIIAIGGSDSSGGAGLARDISVGARLGVNVLPVVTAVTAQTDKEVRAVKLSSPQLVASQLKAALENQAVAAVKIGMLGNEQIIDRIAGLLYQYPHIPLVLDPVLISSSGTRLLTDIGRQILLERLVPRAQILTPNLDESALLTGREFGQNFTLIEEQAHALLAYGAAHILMKGGHGAGDILTDYLFCPEGQIARFEKPRINKKVRGTGCILASAIASHLALGLTVKEATRHAQGVIATYFTDT